MVSMAKQVTELKEGQNEVNIVKLTAHLERQLSLSDCDSHSKTLTGYITTYILIRLLGIVMAKARFAREYMEKLGWAKGDGLGLNRQGDPDPIKVKKKNTTAGLGHDQSKDFTLQWWDHVFNEAASKISVTDSNGELSILTAPSLEPKEAKKSSLYSAFQKKATLEYGFEKEERSELPQVCCKKTPVASISVLTDDELFKACGGRTAHKGARHGHKMTGKLLRLQKQESESIRAFQLQNGEDESGRDRHRHIDTPCDISDNSTFDFKPDKTRRNTESTSAREEGNLIRDQTLVEPDVQALPTVRHKKRKRRTEIGRADDISNTEIVDSSPPVESETCSDKKISEKRRKKKIARS